MGYTRHDCVIAVVGESKVLEQELYDLHHEMKKHIDGSPECILGPCRGVNGTFTYVFAPDGSKEGWGPSDRCNEYRDRFINIVNHFDYATVVHLRLGGDDQETVIVSTTDKGIIIDDHAVKGKEEE